MRVIERLWGAFGKKVSRETLNLTYAAENGRRNDRAMRDELEELWEFEIPVLNMSNGEGYFLPDMLRPIYRYYAQEVARRNAINKKLEVLEKLMIDAAKETFESESGERDFIRRWIDRRIEAYKRKAPAEGDASDKRSRKISTTA